jgi:hypothetical protein
MLRSEQGVFQVRAIQEGDNVNKLSLGKESYTPLKIFLRKTALNFHRYNIAKTYVLMDETTSSRVWEYVKIILSKKHM